MATDLEVGIRIDVPGLEVEAPGSVILPIKRVGSLLQESSDEKLRIESDGSRMRIRGERSEFQFPTQNPDEFPVVRAFEEQKYHQVSARFFRELVRRTVYATDTESSRYALGGVLVELSADGIVGVGTDGRRLARQQGPAEAVGGHQTGEHTVIPARAVQLMERAIADNDENIQLAARENDVLLKSQRTTIYSRLVEGRYPKWRDVFPHYEDMPRVELPVGPFYSAVRQAAIVTSEERRGVDFQFGDGTAGACRARRRGGRIPHRAAHRLRGPGDPREARSPLRRRFPQGARSRQDDHPPPPRLGKCGRLHHRRRLCLRDHALVPGIVSSFFAYCRRNLGVVVYAAPPTRCGGFLVGRWMDPPTK